MIRSTLSPDGPEPEKTLGAFLHECQALARSRQRPILASISLRVAPLDPLAVLEAIYEGNERHFYVERPSDGVAIAGAEAVLQYEATGATRFAAIQSFIEQSLADCVAAGALDARFSGPHFFTAFTFSDHTGPDEAFPAATVFIPRWQVAQSDEGTIAVANFLIAENTPLHLVAEKVLRARRRFSGFEYAQPSPSPSADNRSPHLSTHESSYDYEAAVAAALLRIQAGAFSKIVLARAKDLVAERPFHPLTILNGLRQSYRECYAFSYANARGQSFIGASPERLLRTRKGKLETEALAGSARRGLTAGEDAALGAQLLRSDKDLQEHALVWQSIQRRLSPLGIVLEKSASPVLRKLANVQHLHTPISAALPAGITPLDILSRLHPTPAVGGTPREAALSAIPDFEKIPRGLYAGAIGWIDAQGEAEFFVGLRSALIDGQRARLHAGAGIVAGSEPAKELAETELKFRAMQAALGGGI